MADAVEKRRWGMSAFVGAMADGGRPSKAALADGTAAMGNGGRGRRRWPMAADLRRLLRWRMAFVDGDAVGGDVVDGRRRQWRMEVVVDGTASMSDGVDGARAVVDGTAGRRDGDDED
jgi:hypothetical protein